MDIGDPQREIICEPLEEPVPRELPDVVPDELPEPVLPPRRRERELEPV